MPRTNKSLISGPEDLPALDYLLTPPQPEDRLQYQQGASAARRFTQEQGILLSAGWGGGMDIANWLCGMQNLMLMTIEQPEFVDNLLEKIHPGICSAWRLCFPLR